MMRDRTPYTNDELAEMAEQCEESCPRRSATFRELIALRNEKVNTDHKDNESSE